MQAAIVADGPRREPLAEVLSYHGT
jgi:hypothetical protein